MSDDDWRVKVTYPSKMQGRDLQQALEAGTVDPGLQDHGVILSNESAEDELFLYAGTREYAERAQKAVQTAAGTLHESITTELTHWHPVAEKWESADAALPNSSESYAAERHEYDQSEDADSARLGSDAWEVRIKLPHRQAAIDLAAKLTAEGHVNVRRSHLILLGAPDEDAAAGLAEQIRPELPAGAVLDTNASMAEINLIESELPPPGFFTYVRAHIHKAETL